MCFGACGFSSHTQHNKTTIVRESRDLIGAVSGLSAPDDDLVESGH